MISHEDCGKSNKINFITESELIKHINTRIIENGQLLTSTHGKTRGRFNTESHRTRQGYYDFVEWTITPSKMKERHRIKKKRRKKGLRIIIDMSYLFTNSFASVQPCSDLLKVNEMSNIGNNLKQIHNMPAD